MYDKKYQLFVSVGVFSVLEVLSLYGTAVYRHVFKAWYAVFLAVFAHKYPSASSAGLFVRRYEATFALPFPVFISSVSGVEFPRAIC